jgi:inner membrane transporter RhtA
MRPVRNLPPELLVLGGIGSVQFGSAFADTLFPQAGPGGVVLLRLLLSAAILLAVARPSLRHRTRRDVALALAFGLVLGAMNWSFYEAINRLPLGVAVTIEFTGPLAVAVAGSRRILDGVWVALAGGGVVLLALRGGHHGIHASGVVLALVAAACWAAYILLAERAGRRFAGGRGLALAMAVAALVPLGPGIAQAGSALVRPEFLGLGAAIALLSSVVPYSLEMEALRRMPRDVFGVLMSLEPALAATAGFVVLGQRLSLRDVIAIGLVIAASIGATRARPVIDG